MWFGMRDVCLLKEGTNFYLKVRKYRLAMYLSLFYYLVLTAKSNNNHKVRTLDVFLGRNNS